MTVDENVITVAACGLSVIQHFVVTPLSRFFIDRQESATLVLLDRHELHYSVNASNVGV